MNLGDAINELRLFQHGLDPEQSERDDRLYQAIDLVLARFVGPSDKSIADVIESSRQKWARDEAARLGIPTSDPQIQSLAIVPWTAAFFEGVDYARRGEVTR